MVNPQHTVEKLAKMQPTTWKRHTAANIALGTATFAQILLRDIAINAQSDSTCTRVLAIGNARMGTTESQGRKTVRSVQTIA